MQNTPLLTADEIRKGTEKGLEKYNNQNFLTRYALFMGMCQILEFGLKKLLEERYNYNNEKIKKWTLGRTTSTLKDEGLRPDFIQLLEQLVGQRNDIAHEMLANSALMNSLFESYEFSNKDERTLAKATYCLENIIFLFDWTNQNEAW